ncbi:hypothetical protein U1Q18_049798 [Sarracenia purpurea var. burkii]
MAPRITKNVLLATSTFIGGTLRCASAFVKTLTPVVVDFAFASRSVMVPERTLSKHRNSLVQGAICPLENSYGSVPSLVPIRPLMARLRLSVRLRNESAIVDKGDFVIADRESGIAAEGECVNACVISSSDSNEFATAGGKAVPSPNAAFYQK